MCTDLSLILQIALVRHHHNREVVLVLDLILSAVNSLGTTLLTLKICW
jgi:hypothetical protein